LLRRSAHQAGQHHDGRDNQHEKTDAGQAQQHFLAVVPDRGDQVGQAAALFAFLLLFFLLAALVTVLGGSLVVLFGRLSLAELALDARGVFGLQIVLLVVVPGRLLLGSSALGDAVTRTILGDAVALAVGVGRFLVRT